MEAGARTRTAGEEAELKTVRAGLQQAQAGLSALAARGQSGAGPYQKLSAQCDQLLARQQQLEELPKHDPSRPELATAPETVSDASEEAAWAEQQRLLELRVDGVSSVGIGPAMATPAVPMTEEGGDAFDGSNADADTESLQELQQRVAELQSRCEAADASAAKAQAAETELAQQQAELRITMSECMAAGEMDLVRRALSQQTELEEKLAAAQARRERMVAKSAAAARALVGATAMLDASPEQQSSSSNSSDCARCVAQRRSSGNAREYCVPCQLERLKEQQQQTLAARPASLQPARHEPSPEPEPEPEPEPDSDGAPRAAQRLPADEMLARGVRDATAWLDARGHGATASDAVAALQESGLPPEEWVLELR